MHARCHQARDVGHVHHQLGAAGVGRLTEFLEVNRPGVGRGAGHNQLGLDFLRPLNQFIIIDALGLRVQAIGDKIV